MFAVKNAIRAAVNNFAQNASSLRTIGQQMNNSVKLLDAVKPHVATQRNFCLMTKPFTSFERPSCSNTCGILAFRKDLLTKTQDVSVQQHRTVIKYSFTRGKRRTVKNVLYRFFRLNWGIWIRTKCGRHKKLYRKSSAQKRRLRQHVFCNASQSFLLDKMVNRHWKAPKYYVDDPYEPYQKREEFWITRRAPKPPTIA
ncbi:39S ribosomal protein L35, mitochondrial [Nilaparvata lugens]|uniref:39S ribosomal protein L35, mitochondrial n=1 Tax=Nilaparvata lugens TaxID=108931 RepID=UPI00193CAB49|nr:39S ribosomal protein L35, mitochondrial [Nilaparvata lugens]